MRRRVSLGDAHGLRILVIHQNFPGQFRRLIDHWSRNSQLRLLGIGKEGAPGLGSIRWLGYCPHRQLEATQHRYLVQMENAVLRPADRRFDHNSVWKDLAYFPEMPRNANAIMSPVDQAGVS